MAIPSFIFGGDAAAKTPQELARQRDIARALLGAQRAPRNVGEGLNALGDGIVAAVLNSRADAGEKAGQERANAVFGNIAGAVAGADAFPSAPGTASSGGTVAPVAKRDDPNLPSRLDFARADAASGSLPSSFLAAVDQAEGGGDYDTLFGHAQRDGGKFAGMRVSEMPIKDVLAFADPSGAYAQSVKGQIGRVATPMGRHQIVGTTLRNAVAEMSLDPNAPFDRQTQDAIAGHLAKNRLAGETTMDGKVAALRSEWEGFKNVPTAQMRQIVTDIEAGNPASSAPVQVASLDPSAGMESVIPPMPEEYARSGLSEDAWKRMNAPDGEVSAPAVATAPASSARPRVAAALQKSVQPAAPANQRVAQALLNNVPVTAGGNAGAITRDADGGPTLQMLMNAANEPFLNDSQRGIVDALIKQRMESADPLRQLQLKKLQRDLDIQPKQWQKLDDNTLFDPASGEIKSVGGQSAGKFRFGGNSVQAQALNGLMESGKLTEEQAQQLAAGKTITDPSTGAMIFMTPDGIFAKPQGDAPAGPSATPASPQPAPNAPAPQPSRPGAIPLTDPKPLKPTETERNNATKVMRAADAINTELDRYAQLVEQSGIEVAPGKTKDNLNTVRQGIMLQLKELFNLGVLNGPDLELMEKMIYDPVVDPLKEGGLSNLPDQLYTSVTGGAGQRAKNSVAELKRMIDGIKSSMGATAPGGPLPTATPQAGALPAGVTEDDIQHTMKLYGLTREQVLERLR